MKAINEDELIKLITSLDIDNIRIINEDIKRLDVSNPDGEEYVNNYGPEWTITIHGYQRLPNG